MPSATRAESLVGIPEVIDGTQSLNPPAPNMSQAGIAVTARTTTRPTFPPLGPPDMLYVRKRYIPVVGTAKIYGYYHFVRGVDVSHAAAISAYIVEVVRNNGLDPLSWVSTGGWEIASATFVAYNIMSKADAVVHVDFPGSTSVIATAPDGREVPLTDTFWAELLVSSVVRDYLGVGETPLYPCLRVISASTALRAESMFLGAAAECAHRWYMSGTDTISAATKAPSRSRIAIAIRDHFTQNARFEAAIEFFLRPRVREADPDCVVHAAAAARIKGDIDQATAIIDKLISRNPQSGLAWMERAEILKNRGELEKAMEAARIAASHADSSVEIWVLLADLYVDLKEYSKAFEALNSADIPPPTLDPFLRKLVPNRRNVTVPSEGASKGTDAVRVLAARLKEERNVTSEKTDDVLAELPGKLMTDAERLCYAVLVKILNNLTWDDMLAVRGECFVMESDVQNGANKFLNSSEENDGDQNGGNNAVVGEGNTMDGVGDSDGNNGETEGVIEVANGVAALSVSNGMDVAANANETNVNGDDDMNANGDDDVNDAEQRLHSLEQLGKTVCKPWLDYLVMNMYEDLRAMAVWNAEEQQHSAGAALVAALQARKARGESVNDHSMSTTGKDDVEDPEQMNDYRRSPDEVAKTSKRHSVDWLRRGELALRLGKREEAITAYWTCVKLAAKEKEVAVTPLSRIMRLSADDGDTKTTLRCADAIWSFLDANCDRKHSLDPTPPVPEVRSCVFRLISKNGLRTVRDLLSTEVEIDRKRIEGLLLDAVALNVDGFSR